MNKWLRLPGTVAVALAFILNGLFFVRHPEQLGNPLMKRISIDAKRKWAIANGVACVLVGTALLALTVYSLIR